MESFLTIKLEVDIWIHLDTSPLLRPLWLYSCPDSPGFGPGVASPVALSPALAHLGLASQIYAWMAGAQVAGPLNDVKQFSKAIPHIPPCADSVRTFGSRKDVGTLWFWVTTVTSHIMFFWLSRVIIQEPSGRIMDSYCMLLFSGTLIGSSDLPEWLAAIPVTEATARGEIDAADTVATCSRPCGDIGPWDRQGNDHGSASLDWITLDWSTSVSTGCMKY